MKKNTTLTELYLERIKMFCISFFFFPHFFFNRLSLFKYNDIGVEGGKAIAEALKTNATLTRLDLLGITKTDRRRGEKRSTFKHAHLFISFIHVYFFPLLICNRIEIEGTRALAEALKINTTLSDLDLVDT